MIILILALLIALYLTACNNQTTNSPVMTDITEDLLNDAIAPVKPYCGYNHEARTCNFTFLDQNNKYWKLHDDIILSTM